MRYLTFIFSFICATSVLAQTSQSIRSGRPGQAIGPYVLGKGMLQIQSGLDRSQAKASNLDLSSTNSNTVIRLGLSESFETSGLLVYQADKDKVTTGDQNTEGLSQLHLGFRFRSLILNAFQASNSHTRSNFPVRQRL